MLDVACGAGYPALAAARAVRPGDRVVASDLSSRMIGVFALRDPGPGEPNPFRLTSADVLRSMLEQTGFSSIDVERLPMTFGCDSPSTIAESLWITVGSPE
ncbi:MAG: class I SAM-dependent methyltransferase [Acidobacteria bacterium]|nr:class I SAM-dependent methyltransferase [Acidobacteriota bacterium]